jgi:hypothetical protein
MFEDKLGWTRRLSMHNAVILLIAIFCINLCAATTTEMVKNGDFSSTVTTNWSLVAKDTSVKGAIVNQEYVITRSAHAALSDSENANISFSQGSIKLEKDKSYIVRFTAKADSAFTAKAVVKMNKSPWNGYSAYTECLIKTTVDTFSFEFRMDSTSDSAGKLELDLGWMRAQGKITLDNISLQAKSGGSANSCEILSNGDFSSTSVTGWLLNLQGKNTATRSVKNGQLEIAVTKYDTGCDTAPYLMQLYQAGLKLQKGVPYKLTFAIKADSIIQMGNYYVGMNKTPWSSYCGYPMLNAGPTWDSSQSVDLTLDSADNSARIVFDLGGIGGPGKIYFDNISLKIIDCNTEVMHTALVSGQASALKATFRDRTLQILGVSSPASVRLYNPSGKEVLRFGELTPSKGAIFLPLKGKTAKGVYFVRIAERNAQKGTSCTVRLINQ